MDWLVNNWHLIAMVLVVVINVLNAISKHTDAKWLLVVIDVLSVLTNADAKGTVKAPLTRSKLDE